MHRSLEAAGFAAAPDLAAAAQPMRWFAPAWIMLPLASRRCLVRNPHNGATLELSSGEYAVLSACEGCRTLSEHETRAVQKLSAPPEHRAAFREVIERCARVGLLIALSDLVLRFGEHCEAQLAPIAGVAIRTADRPKALARLLASAEQLEVRLKLKRRWVVFDDSRDPANEQANRTTIGERRSLDIVHIGRAEASALERKLVAQFPQAQREIGWLLGLGSVGEQTYGRPLNHALLRFAGRRFVIVDDDVVLDPRRPALAEGGFSVSSDADELLWYEDEASLLRACSPLDVDPVGAHASWLGLPLAAAWRRAERDVGGPATIDLLPSQGQRFAANAQVLFTHNHSCGDPGSSTLPVQLLMLPDRSLQWLAAQPQAAAYAFGQRVSWRGQTRLRLTPQRVLTFTTMAGIDNSRLMPPAARSQRNEDVVLGVVANWMYPSAWMVDLPFGLRHDRELAKQWIPATQNFMQSTLHVLYGWIDKHADAISAESAERRLSAIGSLLLDLAAASDARLAELLWQQAADAGSQTLYAIAGQLDNPMLSAQWKALLVPWLKSPALAVDRASISGRVLAPAAVRDYAEAYGRAILAWPQLWDSCRAQNS